MVHKKDTELLILEAATAVFLENGYDGAKTQEIAQRAGINKALLHYYFRDKETLYNEVAKKVIGSFFQTIFQRILFEATFKDFLKNFINIYLNTISSRLEITRFFVWEIERNASTIKEIFDTQFAQHNIEIPVVTIIRKAIEKGEIKPVDPYQLMISIVSVCIFPFLAKSIIAVVAPSINVLDSSFIHEREKFIYDLLWNGVKMDEKEEV